MRYRWASKVMMLWRLRRGTWCRLFPLLRLRRCHALTLWWRLKVVMRGILVHLALLLLLLVRSERRWHGLPTVVLHHGLRDSRVLRMLVRIWWWIRRLRWRTLHLRLRCSLRVVEGLIWSVGVGWLLRRSLSMLWMARRDEIRAGAAKMLWRVLLWMLHGMLRGSGRRTRYSWR